MRAGIHPEYREVLFHDTNANAFFVIGSTIKTANTKGHEGKIYPYVTLDISSASHPFYTGEIRQASNEGRIANFNKRFARFKR
ncbi:type B 50S ribosomal protein L31 [Acinetobacter bereziniae]|uniref:type B 50S ribosomal protein L31 n=1 Tax=Acinetobacter bereziniae TaxID=106648 RepID=UPI0018FF6C36|nr:type B 50S ribosomal protein L31 [Acinetobacter bereziniae]MBJ9902504.1 type B 50S ribosomal protein L31 [Acinetobacter bereziniae]MCU4318764.1 type B 50S ribosomal protein L31 [Acinetobacter bereziniae]MCU4598928.1 type B 50S ribosomal protein L31 [Acinetobacter bereziniae]